jgi:hypothetical protein
MQTEKFEEKQEKKRKDVEISCNEFEGDRASYRPPEKRGIDTRKTESGCESEERGPGDVFNMRYTR